MPSEPVAVAVLTVWRERPSRWPWWPFFVVGYVAAVLLLDTLATVPARIPNPAGGHLNIAGAAVALINHVSPYPVSSLQWRPHDLAVRLSHVHLPGWSYHWLDAQLLGQFDLFKFVFWFLVPLLLCGWHLDLKAFSTYRWRKQDWSLLVIAGALGFLAVCLVPVVPQLRAYYGATGIGVPLASKLHQFAGQLVWTLSWLTGWEFMHRYFLLRNATQRWPRFGWLLPPFFEWAYHLQKPWIEGLGMLLFSLLATQYVLRRRNVALPFFAHLLIEIALPLTLLFSALNPFTWAMAPGR